MYITIIYALIWDVKADLITGQEIVAVLPQRMKRHGAWSKEHRVTY